MEKVLLRTPEGGRGLASKTPQMGEVPSRGTGDGERSRATSMPKPPDQLNTKGWGLWLRSREEDLVNGSQHINY